jgi:hypothetical protein
VKPGEEPLDLPAPTSAAQRPAILRFRTTVRAMGRDQFDVVGGREVLIEAVAVVRHVTNQAYRELLEEPGGEGTRRWLSLISRNMSAIHVILEFEDIETAKRAGRTAFGEMVTFLRKRPTSCRILLVEKTDRLYRNIKDWVTIDELAGGMVMSLMTGRDSGIVIAVTSNMAHANTSSLALRVGDAFAEQTR